MNIAPMPLRPFSSENRRRHSWLWRWLPFAALLVLAVFLVHCATSSLSAVPPRARQVAPPVTASSVPAIESIRDITARADRHGEAAAGRVKSAKDGLGSASEENRSLVAEVDRLHKQKSASENELLALYNRLVAQERKFQNLFIDLTTAEMDLSAERALREEASAALVATQQQVRDKEAESALLRSQLAHESAVADGYQQSADAAARLAADNAKRADESAGKISMLRRVAWILGILVALSVGLNILQLKTGIL